MIKTIVRQNSYMDSILILSVSREIMKFQGVHSAVVVMATDMNKTVVDEFGGMTAEARAAGPNDLLISIDCEEESVIPAIQAKVKSMVEGTDAGTGSSEADFRTLASAKTAMPEQHLRHIPARRNMRWRRPNRRSKKIQIVHIRVYAGGG